MHPNRRVRPLAIVSFLGLSPFLAVSCASDDSAASADADGDEIAAMCDQIQTVQNLVADAGNAMSAAEVTAEPVERATILADGLEAMIDVVRQAALPTEPADLTAGLADRRDRVIADAEAEAATFRATWTSVVVDDRRSAVQAIFVIGEKLMSEIEPRVGNSTPNETIELARATASCRHVIQLPPPQE